MVKVRRKLRRAYVVLPEIFDTKPFSGRSFKGCKPPGQAYPIELRRAFFAPPTFALSPDAPLTLPEKLEHNSHLALDRAAQLLGMELQPGSREYGAALRALTSTIATVLGTQVRVDEQALQARRHEAAIDHLGKLIREYKERKRQREIEEQERRERMRELHPVGPVEQD